MAGSSLTATYDLGQDGFGGRSTIKVITIAWVSDSATGAASGTLKKIAGRLVKAVTVPSGTAAPTDNYDIALTDEQSVNVLSGSQSTLLDRDTANTEEVYFLVKDAAGTPLAQSVHPLICNALTVSITNAGNSKAGTIYLYVES